MILTRTYTIKSKLNGYVWQFKYSLNGDFVSFEILEGKLKANQVTWLFGGTNEKNEFQEGKFPIVEETIKIWQKKLTKNFEITIGEPDVSFENLLKLYPHNPLSKKKIASERFERLSKADKIKLFLKIPEYIKLKTKENTNFPYLEVFINQRWWDN